MTLPPCLRVVLSYGLLFGTTISGHSQSQPSSADDNWDTQFDYSGVEPWFGSTSGAFAVTYMGTSLYIAGHFDAVGQTRVNSIARWDGAHWHPLDGGILSGLPYSGDNAAYVGIVYAIAVQGTNLYVGGDFKIAGDQYANGISRWDGTAWHLLGTGILNGVQDKNGLPSVVNSLLVVGNDLYVGGVFEKAGGTMSPGIAKWDGTAWSPLGGGVLNNGVPGTVKVLATDGQNVYAGGTFDTAGGVIADNIAKWDGSTWSPLGGGLYMNSAGNRYNIPAVIKSIVVLGTNVYASGVFDTASTANGNVSARGFARWDGGQWSSTSQTVDGGNFRVIFGDFGTGPLLVLSNSVYMPGNFIYPDGSIKTGIARLETNFVWNLVASGIGSRFSDEELVVLPTTLIFASIASDGRRVTISGGFTRLNQESASGLVQWDGQTLSPLNDGGGNGLDEACSALAVSGTNLYAAVDHHAGGVLVNGIARWDGSHWSNLGDGLRVISTYYAPGHVAAITTSGGDVYAGGEFAVAGTDNANNVAKWDGTNWTALGNGINNGVSRAGSTAGVNALAVSGSNVYVGGYFDHAGGLAANGIARWNGSQWAALGSGLDGGMAYSMAMGTDGLYVGGPFPTAGGITSPYIARWDGSAWHSVGGGVDGIVYGVAIYAVLAHGGNIYVAGYFNSIGGVPASGVAMWNGSNWAALPKIIYFAGDGFWTFDGGWGSSLAMYGNDLYVGGMFTRNGRNNLGGIAKLTSNGWVMLGRGFNQVLDTYGPSRYSASAPGCLAVLENSLYAGSGGVNGGRNTETAGNQISFNLARYNLSFDFTRPWINSVQNLPDSSTRCSATNVNAANAFLEATTDFSKWTRVNTNQVTSGSVTFTDPGSALIPRRFYRVALP